MYFNLNPVNFFIVSGLLQGFIIAGTLFFRKSNQPLANKLLSATVLIVNLHLTSLILLDLNVDNLYPSLMRAPYSFLTAIGPLIFLYTKSITDVDYSFSNQDSVHFIPVMVEVLIQMFQIIYGIRHNLIYYKTPLYFIINPIIYTCVAGSIIYYLRWSLNLIRDHEVWARKNFSNLTEITLIWLKKLITYYRLFWILWIPFITTFLLFFRFQLQYLFVVITLYVLMLILTYLTYWIGIEGLRRMNYVLVKKVNSPVTNKNYSNVSINEINTIVDRIKQLMDQDKLFLDENLNLKAFASQLKADPNLVSYILNAHLEQNFYEFVNSYRIEEVKRKLVDPKNSHLSILGMALDSGFSSKTTFNRLFKRMTGVTPNQFQKNNNLNKP